MDPTAVPAAAGPAPVELIVQNGRLLPDRHRWN
jgi:hypothetical protein